MKGLEIDPSNLDLAQMNRPKRQSRAAKTFETEWVKFPLAWYEALRRARCGGATYELAVTILFEAFKREHIGGEIVLSAEMTRMPKNTRIRAAKELMKLGLIKLRQTGNGRAYRISIIL
jgi:hypothetical protein